MMNNKGKIPGFLTVLGVVLVFADTAMSLIVVGGEGPIRDHGWAAGTVETANLPTRFAWWEGPPFGGGEYHFLYRCRDTDQFNDALERFAAIEAKRLELVLHNGPKMHTFADGRRVDWTLLAWVRKNWDSLNNKSRDFYRSAGSDSSKPVPMAQKTMPAPRIDVYLGGENPVNWKDVKVPENLVVIDQRPGSVGPEFAGKGLVRGRVFDLETGRPIAGATVMLYRRVPVPEPGSGKSPAGNSRSEDLKKARLGETNAQGTCQIGRIGLGRYEVSVAAEGYVPVELERYDNTAAECYDFEIGLLRPFTITGVVTDDKGTPLKDVGVSAHDFVAPDGTEYGHRGDSPVLTDAQGRFEIPDLPKGFVRIRCRFEGLRQANSIFQRHRIPSKQLRLTMSATGIVRGKVVDKNGKAVTGDVHVHIRCPGEQVGKWGGSAKCKDDGGFEFKGAPPVEYFVGTDVLLLVEGDTKNAKKITVEAGKICNVEIVHVEQRRRR